jgi:signal transduction histidine kinase
VLESPRFFVEPVATEWGFSVLGGNGLWLFALLPIGCVVLSILRLRELDVSPTRRHASHARFLHVAAALLVAGIALDLISSLRGSAAPRFTSVAVVLAGASFWRPGRGVDDWLHPGAFDAEIFDALSDGVAVLRDDGCIRAANSSLEALTQTPRHRLIDRSLGELLGPVPDDLSCLVECHTTLLVEDEQPVPVSITSAPLCDRQGAVIGCAVAIRDRREIVDLKRHLVTSARFAAVGELAAGIAHEVNNPLAFIQANLNQMQRNYQGLRKHREKDGSADESVFAVGEGLIQDCLSGVANVASIVREVRGFAQDGDEVTRLCDVNALLESAMRMAVFPSRPRIEVERGYSELPAIHCREQDLKQLFLGLVMHAVQPSRSAGRIRLVTEALAGTVRVFVEDDGLGYAEEALDRVFDPVLDEEDSLAKEGMGLSIAYHLARQLGGEIEIESEPGGRTRVGVVLPLEAVDGLDTVGTAAESAMRLH